MAISDQGKSMGVHAPERVSIDGTVLESQVVGAGEPVVLVHGSHIADAFVPLLSEPALVDSYRLITYHRRGLAGSTHPDRPLSIAEQAADCRGLLRALGIDRAHVVGHSYGGVIALQLALDAPALVHSLALLEPALMAVPSAPQLMEALGPAVGMYQAGTRPGRWTPSSAQWSGRTTAARSTRWSQAATSRRWPTRTRSLTQELPALQDWRFTREEAQRITQPVLAVLGADSSAVWPGFGEGYAVLREWFPQAEGFTLPGATHALQMQNPRPLAEALARFLARHPLPTRA